MKRIIQTYKSGCHWISNPPGLGDFIRGMCHLHEIVEGTKCKLKVDISQTEFSALIDPDLSFFHIGKEREIANAEEFFEPHEHKKLHALINQFLSSQEEELYVCTNLGAWNRTSLPDKTREFAKKFYCFNANVTRPSTEVIMEDTYEALSIRTGDQFLGKGKSGISDDLKKHLFKIIENKILPCSKYPIIVTSDSYHLKSELAARYNFIMFPHVSQHGAYGNALPVAKDMNLLKNSKFNYHINAWKPWWSGFSHYTSLIFLIPSANFRNPRFVKEEIINSGELCLPMKERLLLKLQRLRGALKSVV